MKKTILIFFTSIILCACCIGCSTDSVSEVITTTVKETETILDETETQETVNNVINTISTDSKPIETQSIAIGDCIATPDYEFTLNNIELSYEVYPPNTNSAYTSYPAESGMVYVHVDAYVKNLMKRDIRIEELFSVSANYDNGYMYQGFVVVNDGDNSFDWVSNYVAATPLETCHAHGLIECPVEVDETDKPLSVIIELSDGNYYEYVIR